MSAPVAEQAIASFEASGASVMAARRFVTEVLRRWGAEELLDDAVLLVSELVTNAVVHAGTQTDVRCTLTDDGLQIDVVDRYPGRWLPSPPMVVDSEAEGGRGLSMAATLSNAWGVSYAAGTKRVWFLLRRTDVTGTGLDPHSLDAGAEPGLLESGGSPLELDEMLRRIVARLRDLTSAEVGYAFLLSEDGEELHLRASAGLPGSMAETVPAHQAARTPVLLRDVEAEPPVTAVARAVSTGTGLRSVLTVPMLVEGRLIGVLGVGSPTAGQFADADAARVAAAVGRVALAVQTARVLELERQRRGWVAFLAEASDLLGGTLQHDMILALLGHLVVPRLSPWCAVHVDAVDGSRTLAYVGHEQEQAGDDLRALLTKAEPPGPRSADERPAGVGSWQPAAGLDVEGSSLEAAAELVALGATTIPLLARGRTLGVLTLGNPRDNGFRREVLDLAEDLGRRAALALDNARLYSEREATARALQASLLPPAVPEVPFLEVGVAYEAAGGHEVGGDFYDVFAVPDGTWRFAVGDVCGKGPEAAAVTGLARQALRLLGRELMPVTRVLQRLNGAILDEGARSRFLTMVAGEAYPKAAVGVDGDGVRLRLVCAGHPLPVVVGPHGPRVVGTPQPLLGVLEDLSFAAETVDLEPGECLVLVTDGVTERRRRGGAMIGESGLLELLAPAGTLSAPEIAALVQRRVVEDGDGPPRDDLAVLVLKVPPRAPASA
ncbi:MAG: SpoIIE family protein phosphatase [Kineosporiaceae bacterium]